MEQPSDYQILKSEGELRSYLDRLYAEAKTAKERGEKVRFKGPLEVISSPITIQTAIHNIKANSGADTSGTDEATMRDLLEKPFEEVIWNVEFNHIKVSLPTELINRVPNLASVCNACHDLIHSNCSIPNISKKIFRKLNRMREKLTQI